MPAIFFAQKPPHIICSIQILMNSAWMETSLEKNHNKIGTCKFRKYHECFVELLHRSSTLTCLTILVPASSTLFSTFLAVPLITSLDLRGNSTGNAIQKEMISFLLSTNLLKQELKEKIWTHQIKKKKISCSSTWYSARSALEANFSKSSTHNWQLSKSFSGFHSSMNSMRNSFPSLSLSPRTPTTWFKLSSWNTKKKKQMQHPKYIRFSIQN